MAFSSFFPCGKIGGRGNTNIKQQMKANSGRFRPRQARNCLGTRFWLSHWPRGSLRGKVLPCTSLSVPCRLASTHLLSAEIQKGSEKWRVRGGGRREVGQGHARQDSTSCNSERRRASRCQQTSRKSTSEKQELGDEGETPLRMRCSGSVNVLHGGL